VLWDLRFQNWLKESNWEKSVVGYSVERRFIYLFSKQTGFLIFFLFVHSITLKGGKEKWF